MSSKVKTPLVLTPQGRQRREHRRLSRGLRHKGYAITMAMISCGPAGLDQVGIDSRGRIKIESKEEMRKPGLPSPDRADAVAKRSVAVCKRARLKWEVTPARASPAT